MRKFLAFMMMFIILTGVFSPVTFLLNKDQDGTQITMQKNVVNALEADSLTFDNFQLTHNSEKKEFIFSTTVLFINESVTTDTIVPSSSNEMHLEVFKKKNPLPNPDNLGDIKNWEKLFDKNTSFWTDPGITWDPDPVKFNVSSVFSVTLSESFMESKGIKSGEEYRFWFFEGETDEAEKFKASKIFTYVKTDDGVVQIDQQNASQNIDAGKGFSCGTFNFYCHIVKFTTDLFVFVPNAIATFSGIISDLFLKIAITPGTYGANYTDAIGGTIYDAWKIMRDFANIGFIFALFVSAFMLILNKTNVGGTNFDPKKVVTRVIIMALLVNFSLFFCRMIIQTADVFSHLLYNQINQEVVGDGLADRTIGGWLKKHDIRSPSFALVTKVNPQTLIMSANASGFASDSLTSYLIVSAIAFIVYLILIYVFISMLVIWLVRIFGSWISMILSPLAFVSWAIPFIENNKHIGFNNWLENFVKLAFLVPTYLFFVYLAVTVLNLGGTAIMAGIDTEIGGTISTSGEGSATALVSLVLKIIVPLLGAVFILMKGKTLATDMAGEAGKLAGKVTGMATSVALGAATGGTALLARQTLGRAGNAIGNSTGLMNAEAGGGVKGMGARMLRNTGKGMGAATFDVRNSPSAMKGFSKFTGAMGEKIDLGDKFQQKEGGFKKEGGIRENLDKATTAAVQWNEDRKKANADALAADMAEVHAKERKEQEEILTAAEQAKASEETNIKTEANNQLVVNTINITGKLEANELAIDQINTDINKVNTDIAQNNTDLMNLGFNQSAYDDAMRNKAQADTDVGNIQKELTDNREKQKTAGYGHSAELKKQEKEIETKLKNAENVQKVATETAKTQDDKLAEKTRLETKALDLSKTREDLEKAKTNLEKEEDKLHSYLAYEDYTLIEAEEQINADKIAAENTDSGRDYKRAQGETKEQEKKVSELQKQKTSVEKEYGKNSIEADKIQEKINKEKKTLDDIKKVEKDLKEIFEEVTGVGHLNSMLDAIKEEKKKYITNQQHRVDDTERYIGKIKVDLAQTIADQNKELYSMMNTAAENAQRGSIIPDFTGARAATASTHIQNKNMGTGSYGNNNNTSGNTNNKGKK